jgi:hypothetical protein
MVRRNHIINHDGESGSALQRQSTGHGNPVARRSNRHGHDAAIAADGQDGPALTISLHSGTGTEYRSIITSNHRQRSPINGSILFSENVLISCRGGDGEDGGRGGDGMKGSNGYSGTDATTTSDARVSHSHMLCPTA